MASPLAERILPARGAAQKASASIAEQLTDSPPHSSPNPFREPASRTTAVKYRYSATGKHLSSPLKSSPEGKDRHKARKRKADLSSPSPLTSAPTTPAKEAPPPPRTCLPKRLPTAKSHSMQVIGHATPKRSVFSQPLSPKRKVKAGAKKDTDSWIIGNFVWVLVDPSGVLADNVARHLETSDPLMWWPAQIVQSQPLRVSLFGDFPSSSSSSRGLCTIFAPSSSNVRSINDDSGARRFSRTTFCIPADDAPGPPAKKARIDNRVSIQAKWDSAVQSMEKASTLEKEGLPALLSSYAATGGTFDDSLDDSELDTSDLRQSVRKSIPSTAKKSRQTGSTKKPKSKRSRANLKDDATSSAHRESSPCPPDPTLQIPGELILAMAPKAGGFYWPAKIMEHIPARKEKYRVKFLDEEEYVILRDKFWTSEEDGFVYCTLGEWESAVKTLDDPESEDEAAAEDDNYADTDDVSKLPPPPPAKDFEDLSARAQLAYVKPVLRAILSREYAPAREKHDTFMKGGSGRVSLMKSAGLRGGMDARFIKAVQKAICEWVLGDGGMRPEKLDIASTVTGTDARNGMTEVGEAAIKADSPANFRAKSLPPDTTEDVRMEGVEPVVGDAEDVKHGTGPEPLSMPDRHIESVQDSTMAVDGQGEQPTEANSVATNPAVKQASLAHKSQLDLLAEVSQAVATEPSLLHSHPEVLKLSVNVDLLGLTRKDSSCLPSPLTPIPGEDSLPQTPLRRALPTVSGCEEFGMLSGVEKLDYCLNILLPEAIQQLLLWRSGERTSAALLSPEEEQRLHTVGSRKCAETDWVDDLMRLRAAQARLRGIVLDKVEVKKTEVAQGGTRSRTRRGTVSKP